jgi:hypothetical protein
LLLEGSNDALIDHGWERRGQSKELIVGAAALGCGLVCHFDKKDL